MANNREIGVVIATLSAAYPHLSIPDETVRIYCEMLADMPADELMDSAREYICRGSKFFPTIFELRQPYEERLKREKQERDDREWKQRIEGWKDEALPAGEASRLVAEVNERAGTALVTQRNGMSKVVKRDFEAGAKSTDEEWQRRIERVKEKAGA